MSLDRLKEEIRRYTPWTSDEDPGFAGQLINLIDDKGEECLERGLFEPGHIVSSGLVMDVERELVLLNHHKSLDMWLGFGGHLDGDSDTLGSAAREVAEESGLQHFSPLTEEVMDIDIHTIPANPAKDEPAHVHFDIGYFFQASSEDGLELSEESNELKWIDFDTAFSLIYKSGMKRFVQKAQMFVRNLKNTPAASASLR